MKTIEETTIDKSDWGSGPWEKEPDKIQWEDKKTRLPCLIVRHPVLGHLCGYVGVSKKHPKFGKGYDDQNVNVHGGLTYASPCMHNICHIVEEGEDDNVWWLGFDCGHLGDTSPGMMASMGHLSFFKDGTYKNIDYVKNECQDLARQLKGRRKWVMCQVLQRRKLRLIKSRRNRGKNG